MSTVKGTLLDLFTSAQRYIRPTILRTYPHVVFKQLLAAVGPMYCRSDTHFIEQNISVSNLLQVGCTAFFSWLHFLQVGCTIFVGGMHNFSRSDAQLQQVGCTTLVGQMHNFSFRSDAQLQQISMHNFSRSDPQFLQVECTKKLYVSDPIIDRNSAKIKKDSIRSPRAQKIFIRNFSLIEQFIVLFIRTHEKMQVKQSSQIQFK